MRSLKSASDSPNQSSHLNRLQPEVTSSDTAIQQVQQLDSKRPYRFRTDSWLSTQEANFLLRKRVSWEAKQNNCESAIQLLNKLIIYEPNRAEHYANRGLMYSHMRSWSKALADYNQALAIDPTLDKVYSNRANLHANQRNWMAAIADYNMAVDINPLNIRARLNQAITFREMGDYKEALTSLDIAMFFQPESADLYAERGRAYHLQGDINCAAADYNTALSLSERSEKDSSALSLGRPNKINHRVKKWLSGLN